MFIGTEEGAKMFVLGLIVLAAIGFGVIAGLVWIVRKIKGD